MKHHFDNLRLPPEQLQDREDPRWDYGENTADHRLAVLKALRQAVHDALVARAIQRRNFGLDSDQDPDFIDEVWEPIWNGLRESVTRQDLMRWLMDWALHSVREEALGTVVRMNEELTMLDDDSGAWWLTQNGNPG